ncbi:AraC family transcriptional regulator [Nocardia caishijiensis]|uniref:AraC family transcriptional regulator n=1 Tax=Nocardia caishijiensis TaxID=184756 RepID=A0ABQ6YHL0_9NOCA|nr:AraC family transcriptional regulator [Nocardia caishijiensis]KAF0845021.1 AraC family transcriptional regulator [Nocardia caishijiensis]
MIDSTIPIRTARLIRATALRIGVGEGELRHLPGLDPTGAADGLARVPTASIWRIWELVDAVGGPGAGLHAGAAAERGHLPEWDYLFTSAASLAESVRAAFELRALVTDPGVEWTVRSDGGLLVIRIGSIEPSPVIAPVEEFVLSTVLRRMREATGTPITPVRVVLRQPAPPTHQHLIDAFGTRRIDFGAPHAQLTFLDVGALPTGTDPHLGALVRRHAEIAVANSRPIPSFPHTVRASILDDLAAGGLDLTAVAARFAASPRTFQRRLAEAGTTWRDEVEAARRERAEHLLRASDLPVQAIAARLGYTDARTLRRAFRRWTGQNPESYRRLART